MYDRPATRSGAPGQLPDQVTMGLLPYLNAHALDEDYAVAARRRAEQAPSGGEDAAQPRRRVGAAGAIAMAVIAVLAVVTAAQTSRASSAQESERRALIEQVQARRTALAEDRRTIARLQAETESYQASLLRNTEASAELLDQVRLLSQLSGTSAVRGPGVEIEVDDAPGADTDRSKVLDSDLQKLVNGLWRAGAEAVSINGQRLTNLSAIRHAGSAITVNYISLNRPYRIRAIGNPDQLPARFAESRSGQEWLDLQREVGLQFSMRTRESVKVPAAKLPTLRQVEFPEEGTS